MGSQKGNIGAIDGNARLKPTTRPVAIGSFDRGALVIEGLRQNNLKNISVRIEHDAITAIVGPSGSGKSSLAFDTLFAEGRWRFMESLSTYTRMFIERMDRPDLDYIRNVRPAIAIEQKNPVRGSRSTVGTTTELYDYFRLLFARSGKVHCSGCSMELRSYTPHEAAKALLGEYTGERCAIGFAVDDKGVEPDELANRLLNRGFARIMVDGEVLDLSYSPMPKAGPYRVITDRVVLRETELTRMEAALESAYKEGNGRAWAECRGRTIAFSSSLYCGNCDLGAVRPEPISLSFNHPVGACPECRGFGNILRYDEDRIIPDKSLSIKDGAIEPWTKPSYREWNKELLKGAKECGLDVDKPFGALSDEERRTVFEGTQYFDGIDDFFKELERKKYKLHIKVFISRYKGQSTCPSCRGARLRPEALSVKVGGLDLAGLSSLTIDAAQDFFKGLKFGRIEEETSGEVLRQIRAKLEFLKLTGLGYVTLERPTKTLSGGEAQRVTIATQLASRLSGVLYILDEPSVGLHPMDVSSLMSQIRALAKRGNTVVLVEHDPSMIRASDYVLELGPGSGERGGRVVYSGGMDEFLSTARTLTADYLVGRQSIHVPRWRRRGSGSFVTLKGATGNNLKFVDLRIPLKTLTCVTGVSGSGKSTLVVDTFYNAAARYFGEKFERPLPYAKLDGLSSVSAVKLIDQGPLGRTHRSNPLTYMGAFDEIRSAYADTPLARAMGLGPGDFSFNVPGGRCETCKGEGVLKLEMYFLPDVYIKCAQCKGRRYKQGVLEVKYRGRDISECLEMTFDEAAHIFKEPSLQKRFAMVQSVGLGYLRLGQGGSTLSGGEAQRLKVARELVDGRKDADTLYLFDEPTAGLHSDDIKRLLGVMGKLVDAGNTVVLIEHNLDVIKTADYVVDMGPSGGSLGGRIVAEGTPEDIAASRESVTGKFLKEVLR